MFDEIILIIVSLVHKKTFLSFTTGDKTMLQKITIIGAGNVGATCAQRIVEKELADVVLIDIIKDMPFGKSLDLCEAAPIEEYAASITGTNSYETSINSDIIIVTAGVTRKPGMNRDDLIKTNANIVSTVVKQAVKFSPNAILIIVSNPLDAMCHIAYKASNFPPERVIGMAGILDSARFRFFIAEALNVSVENTHAFVLGGHGDSMVPLPRFSTVAGIPITELLSENKINALCQRTAQGGAEIINLLKTGSAYYAPSSSTVEIAEAILKDKQKILPCTTYLTGQYGYKNLFMGVPVKLGKGGIQEIIKIKLLPNEKIALDKSAETVRSLVNKLTILGF